MYILGKGDGCVFTVNFSHLSFITSYTYSFPKVNEEFNELNNLGN